MRAPGRCSIRALRSTPWSVSRSATLAACLCLAGAAACVPPDALDERTERPVTFAQPDEVALDQLLLPDPGAVALDRPARVVSVARDGIVLDVGQVHGIRPRMAFDVLRPATVVELPLSREVVYRPHAPFARAIVRFADAERATATVVPIEGGVAAVVTGMVAVVVQQALPSALPPAIRVAPGVHAATYGWPTVLRVESDASPADGVRYRWRTSAGWLATEVTTEPENELLSPGRGERARVEVVASGREGDAARVTFDVVLRPRARWARPATIGRVPLGVRGHVADVTFGEAGDVYLLVRHPGGSLLLHSDARGRELGRANAGTWDLGALAVSARGVHVLQAGQVVRFPPIEPFAGLFGDRRGSLLARVGPGNGKVLRAADLLSTRAGHIYVLDAEQRAVQLFGPGGRFLASFGEPGAYAGGLEAPVALSVRDEEVLVLDDGPRKSLLRYRRCELVSEARVGGPGSKLVGVALDPVEPVAYVLDAATRVIKRASSEGTLIGRIEPAEGLARLVAPTRLRIDPWRRLHVIDGGTIARFFPDGTFVGRWGITPGDDQRVSAGVHGELAVIDVTAQSVSFVDARGWVRWHKSSGASADAPLRPIDACFDAGGRLHVLDAGRGELVRYDAAGTREATTAVASEARWVTPGPARQGVLVAEGAVVRLVDGPRPLQLSLDRGRLIAGEVAGSFWRARDGAVERIDAEGTVKQRFAGLGEVRALARSPGGYVLVASELKGCVALVDDGQLVPITTSRALGVACDDRGLGYVLESDTDGVVSLRVIGPGAP